MHNKNIGQSRWLILGLFVIALDQLTKIIADHNLLYLQSISIIPDFMSFTLVYNHGAAFSFLSDENSVWQLFLLSGFAVVVVVTIIFLLRKVPRKYNVYSAGLAMIAGGAVGNVIDRILYGHVVDFIDFYIKSWHWPAFNVADMGIFLGVMCILFSTLFLEKK